MSNFLKFKSAISAADDAMIQAARADAVRRATGKDAVFGFAPFEAIGAHPGRHVNDDISLFPWRMAESLLHEYSDRMYILVVHSRGTPSDVFKLTMNTFVPYLPTMVGLIPVCDGFLFEIIGGGTKFIGLNFMPRAIEITFPDQDGPSILWRGMDDGFPYPCLAAERHPNAKVFRNLPPKMIGVTPDVWVHTESAEYKNRDRRGDRNQ